MIIDFHTHIGVVRSFSKRTLGWIKVDLDDLVTYMDTVGVDAVVLLALPGKISYDSDILNSEQVLKVAEKYPGRIIPFCAVDPRVPNAGEKVRRFIERRAKGVGEFKVTLPFDHKKVMDLLNNIRDLEIPFLVHIEEGKYCYDIKAFERVVSMFPEVKFIAHGPGWWKHISGKAGEELYPSGKILEEGLVHKILREYPNAYADISAFSGLNALKRDPEHAVRFLTEFADKVVFGTDFPCMHVDGSQFGPNRVHLELLESLKLPKQVLEKILYKNAVRLLGLE